MNEPDLKLKYIFLMYLLNSTTDGSNVYVDEDEVARLLNIDKKKVKELVKWAVDNNYITIVNYIEDDMITEINKKIEDIILSKETDYDISFIKYIQTMHGKLILLFKKIISSDCEKITTKEIPITTLKHVQQYMIVSHSQISNIINNNYLNDLEKMLLITYYLTPFIYPIPYKINYNNQIYNVRILSPQRISQRKEQLKRFKERILHIMNNCSLSAENKLNLMFINYFLDNLILFLDYGKKSIQQLNISISG